MGAGVGSGVGAGVGVEQSEQPPQVLAKDASHFVATSSAKQKPSHPVVGAGVGGRVATGAGVGTGWPMQTSHPPQLPYMPPHFRASE